MKTLEDIRTTFKAPGKRTLADIQKADKPKYKYPGFTPPFGGVYATDLKDLGPLDKLGIPEIGKAIREMVAPTTPYTQEESDRMAGELPKILENIGVNVLTLGGLAGPLMGLKPSELRAALKEESEELAGFGPALTPAAGETALLAVEWGYLYPKLFAAVGATGAQIAKIPRVAKGMKALKSLGGLEKVATKYPRTFNTATKALTAFTKGATVGTIIATPEALGEELPTGEALKHISKRAALLGGISAGFQLASTADTAIYAKRLRNALIKASNQRFSAKIGEIQNTIPQGVRRSAAFKSLESLKRIELQNIDGIVSAAEAHLMGLKSGKMYQQGQEMVETPQRAAERFIKLGYLSKSPYPVGEPSLKKGLGKAEPFIKMPTTRVGEAKESIVEAMKVVRHPVRAAERAAARTLPKVTTPDIPTPSSLITEMFPGVSAKVAERAAEMLEEGWTPAEIDRNLITPSKFLGDRAIDQVAAKERVRTAEDRKVEREIAEMDAEYAEITGQTPATEAIPAPDVAPERLLADKGVELPIESKYGGIPFPSEEPGRISLKEAFERKRASQAPAVVEDWQKTQTNKQAADLGFTKADQVVIAYLESRGAQVNISGVPLEDWYTYRTPEGLLIQSDAEIVGKGGYPELRAMAEEWLSSREAPAAAEAKPEAADVAPERLLADKGVELPPEAAELTKAVEIAPKVTPTRKKTIEDLREAVSDEELSGITKPERRRLIKENAAKIEASDIYQNEVAGLETAAREVEQGYYYIDKGYRGEVEAIIGKRKGFPTKIQAMFTFDPNAKRIITLQDGTKAEVGPTPWESAVQEGLGRGKEGVDQTWGEMDISEFVQRVVDSYFAQEMIGGINKLALERAEQSGRPDEQLLAEKHRMLAAGYSDQQINEMVAKWAAEWGLKIEDVEGEFVAEYGPKLRQIKKMEDPWPALEQLATEQIEKEERQAAAESAKEVLEANDIEAEVREVEEIYEDDVPFERRGKPVGAAITQGQKQVILLAFGADSETGYHEGYHILRRRLTEKNIRVLDKYFKDEEAEATAFAEYVKTGKTQGFLRGIWQKLRNLLRKVKSGLQGRGFRTAEDIFGEIRKGTVEQQAAREGIDFEERKPKPTIVSGYPPKEFKFTGRWAIEERSARHIPGPTVKGQKRKVRKLKVPIYRSADGEEFLYMDGAIEAPAARGRGIKFETKGEGLRREAEKKAQIKARAARLADQAGVKKRRVRQAPRIRLKLQDHTPLLRPDLAPLPPEAAEERPLKTKTLTKPVYTEKWFEDNLKREKRSILDKAGSETRRAWMGLEKVFSSSSTRLNNIAPKLFRATRQYIYDVMTRSTAMIDEASDFFKATRKMSKVDWRQLDLALKNRVEWKIDQIVAKYNLTEEYQKSRVVLDEIFGAAKEVGIDIEYMRNYWPRVLKDPEGFLMYFQGREDWSIIEEAIKRRAAQAGRKIEDLTVDEKAHVINILMRGYRTQALTLSRPGPAKERTVESIDKELDTFYDDSRTAFSKYVKVMNAKIAEREFFGRETKEIQNLRKTQSARLTRLLKLKRRVGLKYPSEPSYKEHISKTAQDWKEGQERLDRLKARPLSETIGGYVMGLQAVGDISPTQEKEIQNILTGIFDPQRMGSRMGIFATGVYIDTLNSPLQALTQLDEFAYSFYRSPLRSVPVAIRTAPRKSKITPRDIGITSIGEEFEGPSMQRALSLLLKSTGFEMIDRLNKENYINTVLSKYQAEAKRKKLKADFIKRIRRVFGEEYKGVIEDLRNNRVSDNVKYLLFNELLDIQPIAITEMPEAYNKAGNMRILYSLKTFYMKRLDFIRNECFKDMKSPKTFARGFGKLVWLAGSFALLGAGSDFLKDFIKGKPFDLEDSIVDNLLRMAFFSKYQAWRTREKGLGTALLEGWRPPTKAIDAVTRDVINVAMGKERGFEIWKSVPIGGEFYYWWFGEGRRRIEKREKKSPVD